MFCGKRVKSPRSNFQCWKSQISSQIFGEVLTLKFQEFPYRNTENRRKERERSRKVWLTVVGNKFSDLWEKYYFEEIWRFRDWETIKTVLMFIYCRSRWRNDESSVSFVVESIGFKTLKTINQSPDGITARLPSSPQKGNLREHKNNIKTYWTIRFSMGWLHRPSERNKRQARRFPNIK